MHAYTHAYGMPSSISTVWRAVFKDAYCTVVTCFLIRSRAVMEFTSRRSKGRRPQITVSVPRSRPDAQGVKFLCLTKTFCAFRNATRHLSFQIPTFCARYPSTSRDMFIPESPDRPTNSHYWGPGELLPTSGFQTVATSSPVQTQTEQPDLYSLVQGMQNLT